MIFRAIANGVFGMIIILIFALPFSMLANSVALGIIIEMFGFLIGFKTSWDSEGGKK